jgi:NAD(P)-dependent dehydrogenase (short-subunit alcohol dehydrogenase family)
MPSQPANQNALKVALVTGAAKRIGKSIALRLAEDGWNVAIHYRSSAAKAEAVAAEARLRGVKAMTVEADLANEREVEAIIPKGRGEPGRGQPAGQQRLGVRDGQGRDRDPRQLGQAHRDQPARALGAVPGRSRASSPPTARATSSTCWTSGCGS